MNITPQPWARMEAQQTNLLPTRPNHPFFYNWHPSNWDFIYWDVPKTDKKAKEGETFRKGFFIPMVRMERIVPGVNGIHQINGEIGNPSSRIGQKQQKGWVYLDPQRLDYMHVYPVRGGRYHVPKWMNIKVVAGQLIQKMDVKEFQLWCVNLLCSNMLGQPEPHFWELAMLNLSKQPDKMRTQQHIPEVKQKMDTMYQTIKDMKAFIAEFEQRGLDIYEDMRK